MKTKIIEIEINDYSEYTDEQLEDKIKVLLFDIANADEENTMEGIKSILEIQDINSILEGRC